MKPLIYTIPMPHQPREIVFVNGVLARNPAGFLWIWKNLISLRQSTGQAPGCIQVKAGICSPKEIVMVSYWESENHLIDFFRGAAHRQMMEFTKRHPNSLCLYNETYHPAKSGKYSHEPQGMAIAYAPL